MGKIDSSFWNDRYLSNTTGWDLGKCSEPLLKFFSTLKDKSTKILIPGCGNAHEAEYLHENGFTNIFIADWAEQPLNNFASRVPGFPKDHLLQTDFFEISDTFDLIIEQTFFCAIDPILREKYVEKVWELLRADGILAGVLFDAELYTERPPFGGDKNEYVRLFSKNFEIQKMDKCQVSDSTRMKKELFIQLKKK